MNKLHVVEFGETTPPRYALHLQTKVDRTFSPLWSVTGSVVRIDREDGKPRNMLQTDRQKLGCIQIGALLSQGLADGQPYGVQVVADPIGRLTLSESETITSTLRTIHAGLDKLSNRFGPTSDFGSWVARFMDVCGIDEVVVQTAPGWDNTYITGEYDFIPRADVPAYIARLVDQARTQVAA